MTVPRNSRELLQADMRRAQNLISKFHPDAMEPQFRIATPEGDHWIALTLPDNAKERAKRLALLSDFMTWKLSAGFTLASELHEPDSVHVAGIIHKEQHGLLSLITRKPLSFTDSRWLSRGEVGDDIPAQRGVGFQLRPNLVPAFAAAFLQSLARRTIRSRRANVSPHYTTRIDEILRARA